MSGGSVSCNYVKIAVLRPQQMSKTSNCLGVIAARNGLRPKFLVKM